MNKSLYTATTGMMAQQLNVDVISHNLANVNTVGFKKSRADFQDLLYQTIEAPGTINSAGGQAPTGIQIGSGVKASGVTKLFGQGDIRNTQNELDIAIEGKGFYQIQMPDGSTAYSRAGNFQLDSTGQMVNVDGYPMIPSINVPQDATLVSIDREGKVNVMQPGSTSFSQVGQIELANFVNPAGLLSEGKNMYRESDASGPAITGLPDTNEFGSILQGFIEVSNVSVVEELTQMIIAQRGYEVNSKAVQASDEMLQQATNLKR